MRRKSACVSSARCPAPIARRQKPITLTTIYMMRVSSIYQGETTIQIDQAESSVFNLKELRINVGDDGQDINTQLRNLRSPTIAYLVIKALKLERNERFLPHTRPISD